MNIGEKIKDLRIRNGLTQEELANRCDLTKGYISQLENELTSPSIHTLVDILSALGTDLKTFFADDKNIKVVYKQEDFVETIDEGSKITWLVANSQKNDMEPILYELDVGATSSKDKAHQGQEFGFILDGEVMIYHGIKSYRCVKGEVFYYDTSKIHYIKNIGNETAKILWVSSPPNF